jgi:hypothetical protein
MSRSTTALSIDYSSPKWIDGERRLKNPTTPGPDRGALSELGLVRICAHSDYTTGWALRLRRTLLKRSIPSNASGPPAPLSCANMVQRPDSHTHFSALTVPEPKI